MKIIVNGCFDLFHPGHEYLLGKALEWADYGGVYVLLNSDESVTRLKGKDRPIDSYITRAKKIEDFKVSWCIANNIHPYLGIIKFNTEEELEDLINNIEPDMILKGNDRPDVRDIIGSKRWLVGILPRIEGFSTTKLIKENNSGQ